MADPAWNQGANTASSFGRGSRPVTPHASNNIDPPAKAVVVTDITAGADIAVVTMDNSVIPFVGVSVGFVPPFQVKRVNASGTTVTACYTID